MRGTSLLQQSLPVLYACGERAARALRRIPTDTTADSLLAAGTWHILAACGALYVHSVTACSPCWPW